MAVQVTQDPRIVRTHCNKLKIKWKLCQINNKLHTVVNTD